MPDVRLGIDATPAVEGARAYATAINDVIRLTRAAKVEVTGLASAMGQLRTASARGIGIQATTGGRGAAAGIFPRGPAAGGAAADIYTQQIDEAKNLEKVIGGLIQAKQKEAEVDARLIALNRQKQDKESSRVDAERARAAERAAAAEERRLDRLGRSVKAEQQAIEQKRRLGAIQRGVARGQQDAAQAARAEVEAQKASARAREDANRAAARTIRLIGGATRAQSEYTRALKDASTAISFGKLPVRNLQEAQSIQRRLAAATSETAIATGGLVGGFGRMDAKAKALTRTMSVLAFGPLSGVGARLITLERAFDIGGLKLAAWGAAAGAAAIAIVGLGRSVRNTVRDLDASIKTADRLGVSFQFLQEFEFIAAREGVENFTGALEAFVKRAGELETGSGQAKRALDLLGLSFQDLAGQRPEEQFFTLIDAFQDLTSVQSENAVAALVGSRANQDLVRILRLGRSGIGQYREEIRQLGIVVGDNAARDAERAADQFTNLDAVLTAASRNIGSFLTPTVIDATEALVRMGVELSFLVSLLQEDTSRSLTSLDKELDKINQRLERVQELSRLAREDAEQFGFFSVESLSRQLQLFLARAGPGFSEFADIQRKAELEKLKDLEARRRFTLSLFTPGEEPPFISDDAQKKIDDLDEQIKKTRDLIEQLRAAQSGGFIDVRATESIQTARKELQGLSKEELAEYEKRVRIAREATQEFADEHGISTVELERLRTAIDAAGKSETALTRSYANAIAERALLNDKLEESVQLLLRISQAEGKYAQFLDATKRSTENLQRILAAERQSPEEGERVREVLSIRAEAVAELGGPEVAEAKPFLLSNIESRIAAERALVKEVETAKTANDQLVASEERVAAIGLRLVDIDEQKRVARERGNAALLVTQATQQRKIQLDSEGAQLSERQRAIELEAAATLAQGVQSVQNIVDANNLRTSTEERIADVLATNQGLEELLVALRTGEKDAIQQVTDNLVVEAATRELVNKGLTEQAARLGDVLRAQQELSRQTAEETKLNQQRDRILEQIQTPQEKLNEQVKLVRTLYESNRLNEEEAARAIEHFKSLSREATTFGTALEDVNRLGARAFSDLIVSGRDASDVFSNMALQVADLVFQLLVLQPLLGSGAGGTGKGVLGDLLSKGLTGLVSLIPGFQHGGEIAVHGAGKTVVPMALTSGERVQIRHFQHGGDFSVGAPQAQRQQAEALQKETALEEERTRVLVAGRAPKEVSPDLTRPFDPDRQGITDFELRGKQGPDAIFFPMALRDGDRVKITPAEQVSQNLQESQRLLETQRTQQTFARDEKERRGIEAFGFQHGGDFTVSGRQGPDKIFFPMALTSGERVRVDPAGAGRDRSNEKVNVTIINQTGTAANAEVNQRYVGGSRDIEIVLTGIVERDVREGGRIFRAQQQRQRGPIR